MAWVIRGRGSRALIIGVVVSVVTAPILFRATAAHAAPLCGFGSHTVTVTFDGPTQSATLSRSGSAIQLGGVNCGTATVNNTDLVVVNGGPGTQTFTLSLLGGRFQPGFTAEATGVSEIEFQIDLGTGTNYFSLFGTNSADDLRLGTGGANLNADDDVDVTFGAIDEISVYGYDGADVISGDGGQATGSTTTTPLSLYGGLGTDTLTGGDSSDYVQGDEDADVLNGGAEADSLIGGPAGDTLNGGSEDDYLTPGPGNDMVNGGTGNDQFVAEATPDGADVFAGGGGSDTLRYYGRAGNVTVTLDGNPNDGEMGEGDNIHTDVENAEGGNGADTLTGSAGANYLNGGNGSDVVNGGAGADSLNGGYDASADTLNGGDDDDYLYGGDGADHLDGGSGNDSLYAGPGDDDEKGGPGNDYFGLDPTPDGADTISGGAGRDALSYSSRTGDISVDLDGVADDGESGEGDNVKADVEDLYSGSGADTLRGNGGRNNLQGGDGNDHLFGGGGQDSLSGGAGADTLNGGDGYDYMFGSEGPDHFEAVDGGTDYCDGGAGTDDGNFDPGGLDTVINVP